MPEMMSRVMNHVSTYVKAGLRDEDYLWLQSDGARRGVQHIVQKRPRDQFAPVLETSLQIVSQFIGWRLMCLKSYSRRKMCVPVVG
jgi:hypothetical protein